MNILTRIGMAVAHWLLRACGPGPVAQAPSPAILNRLSFMTDAQHQPPPVVNSTAEIPTHLQLTRDRYGRFRPKDAPLPEPGTTQALLEDIGITPKMQKAAAVPLALPEDIHEIESFQRRLREYVAYNLDAWITGNRCSVGMAFAALMNTYAIDRRQILQQLDELRLARARQTALAARTGLPVRKGMPVRTEVKGNTWIAYPAPATWTQPGELGSPAAPDQARRRDGGWKPPPLSQSLEQLSDATTPREASQAVAVNHWSEPFQGVVDFEQAEALGHGARAFCPPADVNEYVACEQNAPATVGEDLASSRSNAFSTKYPATPEEGTTKNTKDTKTTKVDFNHGPLELQEPPSALRDLRVLRGESPSVDTPTTAGGRKVLPYAGRNVSEEDDGWDTFDMAAIDAELTPIVAEALAKYEAKHGGKAAAATEVNSKLNDRSVSLCLCGEKQSCPEPTPCAAATTSDLPTVGLSDSPSGHTAIDFNKRAERPRSMPLGSAVPETVRAPNPEPRGPPHYLHLLDTQKTL